MTITLIQKLLMSIATLTSFYLLYTIALYRDLTRKISKSIFQFIPGIIMFALGIIISRILGNPTLLFKTILHLKSGFAKGVLSTTVFPYIATSVRTLSLIAGLTSLIDKCWFFWRSSRINYLLRLITVISMTLIAGDTVFKMIFADQKRLIEATAQLTLLSYGIGIFLGSIFIIISILAIPHIFSKQNPE